MVKFSSEQNMVFSTNSELYGYQSGHSYDGLNRLQHFIGGILNRSLNYLRGGHGMNPALSSDRHG
jgi:hypothetical protein